MIDELWLLENIDTEEFFAIFDVLNVAFVEFYVDYLIEHTEILQGDILQHDRLLVDIENKFNSSLKKEANSLNAKISRVIGSVFRRGMNEEFSYMNGIVEKSGKTPQTSDNMYDVVRDKMQLTAGTIRNYTGTTLVDTFGHIKKSLNDHFLKVQSNQETSTEAVIRSVRDLTSRGVTSIQYPSRNSVSTEYAVRRALLTGVNQATIQLVLDYGAENGFNLFYVSEHSDARLGRPGLPPYADHMSWQG